MNQKRWILLVTLIIISIVVIAGGYLLWQKIKQDKGQANLLKTANSSYPDDARYVSFGAGYVFAIPKSFLADETSISGLQLLLPSGTSIKGNNLSQLYDGGVVAVQPNTQVKSGDNNALTDFVNKTVVPDLSKNVGDVSVQFSMPGKYRAATITVKKDGKQARQLYVYGGEQPYSVVAKERSDAYVEASTTLLSVNDSKYKADIDAIKQVVKTDMTMLQQDQIQNLYDSGTSSLKKQVAIKNFTLAINESAAYVHRNIVVPGGSIQNDQFAGQLFFAPASKDDQPVLGIITLKKEDGQWKLGGLQLPTTASKL